MLLLQRCKVFSYRFGPSILLQQSRVIAVIGWQSVNNSHGKITLVTEKQGQGDGENSIYVYRLLLIIVQSEMHLMQRTHTQRCSTWYMYLYSSSSRVQILSTRTWKQCTRTCTRTWLLSTCTRTWTVSTRIHGTSTSLEPPVFVFSITLPTTMEFF